MSTSFYALVIAWLGSLFAATALAFADRSAGILWSITVTGLYIGYRIGSEKD